MLNFRYKARNIATGQYVKAEIQADDESSAAKLIRAGGLVPLDIKADNRTKGGFFGFGRERVKVKDKVLFSRQLSTLINAGIPLLQALRNVERQSTSKPLKEVIGKVASDVEAGALLSSSMRKHSDVFNQVYTSMIAAGETSGTLDKSLERLAVQQEKDADLVSKIRGAMVYPAIVVLVMLLVVGFMVVKVLPQVQLLYEDIEGASLPITTVVLLAVSDFVIGYWWAVLILLVVGVILLRIWFKRPGGRKVLDAMKMRAWPFGPLFRKMYMARFARTGGTLVTSGVPMIQMLVITSQAVNNVHIEKSIRNASEKVKGGKSLSEALEGDPNILPLVISLLKTGEDSGSLEDMMGKVADYYEKEVDEQIKSISTIIEPALMVVLGIVAFILVAAVLLPIYSLAGQSFS